MKKLLISIIITLVLILTGFTIITGLEIGNLNILGITEIKRQNESIDNKIKQATKMASTDYPKAVENLNKTLKEFESAKTDYEDRVSVSTENEIQAVSQNSVYEIGMLWIELGNHAKSEGVLMDVSAKNLTEVDTNSSSEADKKYNCNLFFTATGTYAGIASFIENIEDDSKLGFKIEDFKLIASSKEDNVLQATFTCKNVIIRGISASSVTTSEKNPTASSENKSTDDTVDKTTTNTLDTTSNKTDTTSNKVNNTNQ